MVSEAGYASTLAEIAERLDVPEGARVEIIGGSIRVSPSPSGIHALVLEIIEDALRSARPRGTSVTHDVSLALPETGQRYVPDQVVLPRTLLKSAEWLFPASEALLVVEVVSPNHADTDRVTKRAGYAAAGVPFYLLADLPDRSVALYGDPANGEYHTAKVVDIGHKIHIPEPFDVTIDTAEFP